MTKNSAYAARLAARDNAETFKAWLDARPELVKALNLLQENFPDDGEMSEAHIKGSDEAVRRINELTSKEDRTYIIRNTCWEDLEIYED